jgi:hypothetical protein
VSSQDYPLVNGTAYEYAKVEIRIGTKRITRVKSIKYKDELKPGMARGTSHQKMIRTTGLYDADGSIEIYRDVWQEIKTELGGDGYMEKVFQIVVTYGANNKPLMKDELNGCSFTTTDRSGDDNSSDPLPLSLDLDIMGIKDNGNVPVKGMVF